MSFPGRTGHRIRQRMQLLLVTLCLHAACAGVAAGGHEHASCAGSGHRLSLAAPTLEQPVEAASVAASEQAFVRVVVRAMQKNVCPSGIWDSWTRIMPGVAKAS